MLYFFPLSLNHILQFKLYLKILNK